MDETNALLLLLQPDVCAPNMAVPKLVRGQLGNVSRRLFGKCLVTACDFSVHQHLEDPVGSVIQRVKNDRLN